jgi:hypothetical protein
MTSAKRKPFLSVSNSIAVLIECDHGRHDGLTYLGSSGHMHGCMVRRIRAKELTRKRLMEVASANPGWIDFLTGVKKLHQLKTDDPVVVADAYKLTAAELKRDPRLEPPAKFYSMLVPLLVHALEGLHVVFWRTKDRQLIPGLLAPDMKAAIAAYWLLSPEVRICTHCNDIFRPKRPKQAACSAKCRDAHRLIRFRRFGKGKAAA